MPRALWLLIYLRAKGGIRRALFSGSTRKTISTVIGGVCMFLWLGNFLIRGFTAKPSNSVESIRLFGPIVLVIITLIPLAVGGASRTLAFSPVEIDQLFPAPFSRRQLVIYRLVKTSLRSLFTGLFYVLIFRAHAGSIFIAFIAGCLVWMFASFLTMAFALLEALAGARVRLLRFAPQLFLLAALAIPTLIAVRSGGADAQQVFTSLKSSPALPIIGAPFKPFIMLFTATAANEILLWLAVSLAVTLFTAFIAVRLDAAWLDVSVQATHARAQRLERKTKGRGRSSDPLSTRLQRLVPQLHFAGPARAIIRRHLAATPSVLLVPIIVPAIFAAVIYLFERYAMKSGPENVISILAPLLGMILLFVIPAAARMDFRGDLDHYELLKTLPLTQTSITAAQLATPAALLVLLAWELLFVAFCFIGAKPILIGAMIGAPPAAVVLIAVENILFLAAPTRQTNQQVAALQVTGKRAILFGAKFLILGLCGGLVAAGVVATLAVTGSILAASLIAALILTAEAIAMCLLVARLFRGFDVAVDMPD